MQSGPGTFQHVFDVGCGTGGWLITLAKISTVSEELVGMDANRMFIATARVRAEAEQVSDRVKFRVMGAL